MSNNKLSAEMNHLLGETEYALYPSLEDQLANGARTLALENSQWRWTTPVPVADLAEAVESSLDYKARVKAVSAVARRRKQSHLGGTYIRALLAKARIRPE